MIPVVIPGLDSLVSELSGVKIVLESLKDCVGAVDTAKPLILSILRVICWLSRISRVNLYSWWLCSKNYCILLDLSYLKCCNNLFEIGLLLP